MEPRPTFMNAFVTNQCEVASHVFLLLNAFNFLWHHSNAW
jgi:hypothetical protein